MSRFRAGGALVVAAFLYGVTFPLVKDALDDVTPFAYLVGRFAVATIVVAPSFVRAYRRPSPPADRQLILRAGCIAGVLLFGGYAAQTVGLQFTSASTSAFVTGLYVMITPIIEALVRRRLPGVGVLSGVVVATLGLYLLTGASLDLGRGEWLTLLCAVLFAAHIVYLGSHVRRIPTAVFTGMQLGTVAVLSFPSTVVEGIGNVTFLAVFAVAFTGIACSAVALPLQVWGQLHIPPSRAALILLAEPVFAGVAGYLSGERLGTTRALGALVILVGIVIAEVWTGARDDKPSTEAVP